MNFWSLHSGLKLLKNFEKHGSTSIKNTALCAVHLAINEKTVFELEGVRQFLNLKVYILCYIL